MGKYHIELVTMDDCDQFVKAVSKYDGKIVLEDGNDFRVNARSLIGAMAATEWSSLYCVSDSDIYTAIQKWVVE